MSSHGKVVVVTGAGKGIGRSIALSYAAEGADVILAEINPESGNDVMKQILAEGGKATFIQTDLRIPYEVETLISKTVELSGRLDILINNAGISIWKSPFEISVEEWDDIINTNLRSVFLCSREAAKVMRKQGSGSIVNISSTRALMSEPDSEAYAASKGGITALTHALAASFSAAHIQVNCISPGWIETGDYSKLKRDRS